MADLTLLALAVTEAERLVEEDPKRWMSGDITKCAKVAIQNVKSKLKRRRALEQVIDKMLKEGKGDE